MYIGGMKGNLFLILTLLFAWSLSSVCKQLGTAEYIVHMVEGNLPVYWVVPLFFIVGAIISFATGTSYGTFAILIPIAVPMSLSLGAPMIPTIAAVLSGGIFGDHCSPISDTTLLASMGSACDHIEHVRTQLPYAILVAVITFVVYMISFWLPNPLILLAVLLVAITVVTILLSKLWGVDTKTMG